jgi:quinol-cytochrome oxidoreductase complex cytochrome b subunit
MKWLKTNPLLTIVNSYLIDGPLPSNLTYFYNFGFLLGICLTVQLVTGILVAMHYTAQVDLAFLSVEHLMRDVSSGWFLRYLHANGASLFFMVVYVHIARGLYYASYVPPRSLLWRVGVILFVLMMATAFLGYVLPWGQMSFWGATVITNLLSAIPWIGNEVVQFIWGGYSVDNPTLNRFYSLHYLLPFVISAFVVIHLILLHDRGGGNPLGISSEVDKLPFHPYYSLKDMYGMLMMFGVLIYFLFYDPNVLGHPDNYIPANPLVTPNHIVPEWYFLPFYAILRAIPNKLGGVLAMFGAIGILFFLPSLYKARLRTAAFQPVLKGVFWVFAANFVFLGWLGSQPVADPYPLLAFICTLIYFAYFLIVLPLLSFLESILLFRRIN